MVHRWAGLSQAGGPSSYAHPAGVLERRRPSPHATGKCTAETNSLHLRREVAEIQKFQVPPKKDSGLVGQISHVFGFDPRPYSGQIGVRADLTIVAGTVGHMIGGGRSCIRFSLREF